MKTRSTCSLYFLYYSMFNLKEEGLADFFVRKDSPMIDINMDGVRGYNQNLKTLIRLTDPATCKEFYENKIGYNNLTSSGEYTNGRVMCLFIALYIAKRKNSPYYLTVGGTKLHSSKVKNLNSLLSKNKVIFVSGLSKEVMQVAIRLIGFTAHYYFVRLYVSYCKKLGISDKNLVMTERRFFKLKNEAIRIAKADREKRLRQQGFKNLG